MFASLGGESVAEVAALKQDVAAITGQIEAIRLPERLFETGQMSWALSSTSTIAHGLGKVPRRVVVVMQCISPEYNFGAGDEVDDTMLYYGNGGGRGYGYCYNATAVKVTFGNYMQVYDPVTKAYCELTPAKWRFVVRAWGE